MALLRLCIAPGCDDLAAEGGNRCADHAAAFKARRDEGRAAAKLGREAIIGAELYATAAWRRARKAWISRHPVCADCHSLGLVVAASEVDHIQPHRGDRALFWDRANWQSLCKPCHSRKTAREVFHPRMDPGVPENQRSPQGTGGGTTKNVRGELGKKATGFEHQQEGG